MKTKKTTKSKPVIKSTKLKSVAKKKLLAPKSKKIAPKKVIAKKATARPKVIVKKAIARPKVIVKRVIAKPAAKKLTTPSLSSSRARAQVAVKSRPTLQRTLTAEGWKRNMLRERALKKKKF